MGKYTGHRLQYQRDTRIKPAPRKSIFELIKFYAYDMNISDSEAIEKIIKHFLSKNPTIKKRLYATRQPA